MLQFGFSFAENQEQTASEKKFSSVNSAEETADVSRGRHVSPRKTMSE